MQIKVKRIEDGPALVEIINGESGETVQSAEVNVGQEVVITSSDGPENPPYIGEVVYTPAPGEEVAEAPPEEPPAS